MEGDINQDEYLITGGGSRAIDTQLYRPSPHTTQTQVIARLLP